MENICICILFLSNNDDLNHVVTVQYVVVRLRLISRMCLHITGHCYTPPVEGGAQQLHYYLASGELNLLWKVLWML